MNYVKTVNVSVKYILMMSGIVAYNIKSVPKDLTLEEVLEIYHVTKVLVYEDIKPYIIDQDNLDQDIVIIDYSKYEFKSKF